MWPRFVVLCDLPWHWAPDGVHRLASPPTPPPSQPRPAPLILFPAGVAQFSTWSILASPLILGNDPRSMSQECLQIVLNTEVVCHAAAPRALPQVFYRRCLRTFVATVGCAGVRLRGRGLCARRVPFLVYRCCPIWLFCFTGPRTTGHRREPGPAGTTGLAGVPVARGQLATRGPAVVAHRG